MDKSNKISEFQDDSEFFITVKSAIENELTNLKKVVDDINQMRVEAAYLESGLMKIIDASTWKDISEFIGLAPLKIDLSPKAEE